MLYLVTVWLHIVAACAWVGGLVFFSAVLVPVLRKQRSPQVRELVAGVGKQFRLVGWGSLALLIVTGVLNVLRRVSLSELATAAFWVSPWGQLLLVKLLLVLTTLVISWLHDRLGAQVSRTDEKSPDFQRQRALSSLLGRALGFVALAVVFVAVLLVRGY